MTGNCSLDRPRVGIPSEARTVRAAIGPDRHDRRACREEIRRLTEENARLTAELALARQRSEDLAQSAEIWIRLYEARLAASVPEGQPLAGGRLRS
jgi:hypothetical protein